MPAKEEHADSNTKLPDAEDHLTPSGPEDWDEAIIRLEAREARTIERWEPSKNEDLKGDNAGKDEQELIHRNLARAIQDVMAAKKGGEKA